jgi:hypothetical protein
MPIQELQRMETIYRTWDHGLTLDKLEKKVNELEKTVLELKQQMGTNTKVLAEWQVASLVICGLLSFIPKLLYLTTSSVWIVHMEPGVYCRPDRACPVRHSYMYVGISPL